MKRALALRMGECGDQGDHLGRIEMLEGEVEKAKESERKMLESLASQTKHLEEAKIELEEAKLEIRHLHESIRELEEGGPAPTSSTRSDHSSLPAAGIRFLERRPKSTTSDSLSPSREDVIMRLRSELRSAIEAEEKNKKAMDDLALALKEVMTEMNRLKGEVWSRQSELDTVRAAAEQSELMLKATEEKLCAISDEAERLRLEADESSAAWNAKENGFINCMKASEEEVTELKQDNLRLMAESQRIAREENSKLRDIMKQALNEATVVKEALEIARSENSQLKDLLSDREKSLEAIKRDHENLKISEAAALESVENLKNQLLASAASSTTASTEMMKTTSAGPIIWDTTAPLIRTRPPPPQALMPPAPKGGGGRGSEKTPTRGMARLRSEQQYWASTTDHEDLNPCFIMDKGGGGGGGEEGDEEGEEEEGEEEEEEEEEEGKVTAGHSRGCSSGSLPVGSMSERVISLAGRKDRTYASLSCVSDLTAPSTLLSLHELDSGDMNSDDFHHVGRRIHHRHLDGMTKANERNNNNSNNDNNNYNNIPTKQRKKRQILRKFGELLRRGGVQK